MQSLSILSKRTQSKYFCKTCDDINSFEKLYVCHHCKYLSNYIKHLTSADQLHFIEHKVSYSPTSILRIWFYIGVNRINISMSMIKDVDINIIDKFRLFDYLKFSNDTIFNYHVVNDFWMFRYKYINFLTSKLIYDHTAFPTDIVNIIADYVKVVEY